MRLDKSKLHRGSNLPYYGWYDDTTKRMPSSQQQRGPSISQSTPGRGPTSSMPQQHVSQPHYPGQTVHYPSVPQSTPGRGPTSSAPPQHVTLPQQQHQRQPTIPQTTPGRGPTSSAPQQQVTGQVSNRPQKPDVLQRELNTARSDAQKEANQNMQFRRGQVRQIESQDRQKMEEARDNEEFAKIFAGEDSIEYKLAHEKTQALTDSFWHGGIPNVYNLRGSPRITRDDQGKPHVGTVLPTVQPVPTRNPPIYKTPTPKTDAAIQQLSHQFNLNPVDLVSKMAGIPLNLNDIERHDVRGGEEYSPGHFAHTALGLQYDDARAKGIIRRFHIDQDYGRNNVTPGTMYIRSTGTQSGESGPGIPYHSSEILLLGNGKGPNANQWNPDWETFVRQHGGNVNLRSLTDGLYAVPDGKPVWKFNVPAVPGHDYTEWVNDTPRGREYGVTDDTTGAHDRYVDTTVKPENVAPMKNYVDFYEWHRTTPPNSNESLIPTDVRYGEHTIGTPFYIGEDNSLIPASNPKVSGHVAAPRGALGILGPLGVIHPSLNREWTDPNAAKIIMTDPEDGGYGFRRPKEKSPRLRS